MVGSDAGLLGKFKGYQNTRRVLANNGVRLKKKKSVDWVLTKPKLLRPVGWLFERGLTEDMTFKQAEDSENEDGAAKVQAYVFNHESDKLGDDKLPTHHFLDILMTVRGRLFLCASLFYFPLVNNQQPISNV